MILYLDTSALVALLLEEAGSATAERLYDAADRIVSCRLLLAEGAAALAQAERLGRLAGVDAAAARAELHRLVAACDQVEITKELVARAADLAREQSLRGFDSVHCAAAELVADDELVLASGDAELLRACRALGLATADTSR